MNTSIFATETDSFNINCPVIKWDDPKGFNAIPKGNYNKRNISYDTLKKTIEQFTVHWSVTYTAQSTFSGLNARGLSCNFIIDDNCDDQGFASIYQTLPIIYGAWSQGSIYNNLGAGVEVSYMPQAWEKDMYTPQLMSKYKVPKHDTKTADIHGQKMKVYTPTKAQMSSLVQLIWGICELFPQVKPSFPKDNNGNYITTVLKTPETHYGLLNHYHLTRGKIDTAGLDHAFIEKEVGDRLKLGY